MPRLSPTRARPDRSDKLLGGHAPGHLRDAFEAWIEGNADLGLEGFWYRPSKQAWWDALTASERRRWLFGRLWNCTDVLPSELRAAVLKRLAKPPRFGIWTYGAAVQALAREEHATAARLRGLLAF